MFGGNDVFYVFAGCLPLIHNTVHVSIWNRIASVSDACGQADSAVMPTVLPLILRVLLLCLIYLQYMHNSHVCYFFISCYHHLVLL